MSDFQFKYKCNLDRAIFAFQQHYGVEMAKVIHSTMRGLIQTWMQFDPPKTKKQGVQALNNDMKKIFVSHEWFANNFIGRKSPSEQERIRRYFKTKDFNALQKIQNNGGLFQRITFKPFDKSDIKRNQHGRVIKSGQKIICTNPGALKAYIKDREKQVGRLKGSMARAMNYFGGKVPQWIKRNQEGSFVDNANDKDVQSASASSYVPYGMSVANENNILDKVYQAQAHKLEGQIRRNVLNKSLTEYYSIGKV